MTLNRRELLASLPALTTALDAPVGAFGAIASIEAKRGSASDEARQIGITRHFAHVGARNVHYLRAGTGPPVILTHGFPGSSSHGGAILELARRYTCFAVDAPGFGRSDPLPLDNVTVSEIADALAEFMRTLEFPPCPVYGSHSGAVVAMELAVRHSDLVSGIVVDGLPLFTDAEATALFVDYFPEVPITAEGIQYAWAWTRMRDQTIWFPWNQRTVAALRDDLIASGSSTPQAVHGFVQNLFMCAAHYVTAYRSATFYRELGLRGARSLTVPAVITEVAGDVLPHTDRLPPLRPIQEIHKVASPTEMSVLLERSIERFSGGEPAPRDPGLPERANGIAKAFLPSAHGQLMIRITGARSNPALLLLHDAPGSALFLEPLMLALGEQFWVVAPDLPGCAESDPLTATAPTASDFAAVLRDLCSQLDIRTASVHGIGFGSSIAIEFALRHPSLARRLSLRGVLLAAAEERAELRRRYAPRIALQPNGAHWYDLWLMLRDSQTFWPWYDRSVETLRRAPANFSAGYLHAWTLEVMKQYGSYQHVIDAAFAYDIAASLPAIRVPVLICDDRDHRFAHYRDALQRSAPTARWADFTLPIRPQADILSAFHAA